MGWNAGYAIYEKTIIDTYNAGSLNAELCQSLIEPYQETDIDHGGCCNLKSKDGLSADEIVVMILDPEFWGDYKTKRAALTDKYGKWEDVGDYNSDGFRAFDDLHSTLFDKWTELMKSW